MELLRVIELKKVYTTRFGGNKVEALKNINFSVEEGEYVAIMGESGSGKTTLLNMLASVDRPTSGVINLRGRDIIGIKEKELAKFRREHLGFVFQDFNLLDTFSLEDNIMLPVILAGKGYNDVKDKVNELANMLGIEALLKKFPYEVSGGQKQRVAVARAMITNPDIIFADEPTGALDSKSADELLDTFDRIHQKGQTILMVTHSTKAAARANRILFIKDGEIYHQIYKGNMSRDDMYRKISDTLTVMLSANAANI